MSETSYETHKAGSMGQQRRNKRADDEVQRMLDENSELLSPIACASPSEEPQMDEVLSARGARGRNNKFPSSSARSFRKRGS